jgi:hypothetical protein
MWWNEEHQRLIDVMPGEGGHPARRGLSDR